MLVAVRLVRPQTLPSVLVAIKENLSLEANAQLVVTAIV